MIDKYKETQKRVYKILKKELENDKCSHAYLFETNGNEETLPLVLEFVKDIFCPNKTNKEKECVNCTICHKIDNNIFLDLKIIEPDGMWIKKEQMDELQKDFSSKSVEGNKKVYIIKNAEKLNVQASNSILKFLEEPEENIIAILITNNIYQILSTIVSRCQIISMDKGESSDDLFKNKTEEYLEYQKAINNFVVTLETKGVQTIVSINKLWHDYFKERQDYELAFELLILYYKDVLNYKLNRKVENFFDYLTDIEKISSLNSFNNIIFKINKIISSQEYLKVNANLNLLMDKLVIDLTGGIL